jgi:serine/threonine-protein kinase
MDTPAPLTDRYELTSHLARGGMADVYQGRDTLLGRKVAVKILHKQLSADEAFVKRFRREAQAAANLTHPNIVGIYDWGQFDSTYFIVMELVEGRSLRDVLKSSGALLPRRAIEIAAEVAAALSVAHRSGLVHRDIKPGNILLSTDGTVKVTDFGIARAWDDSQELTRTGAVMGTATYFSPEQAQGAPADERSDVYSLGVVLYEMLTGEPPFRGDSPVAVAYQHVSSDVAPPSAVNADVPGGLDHIVLKAMHKDPASRYQTAEDLRADLWRALKGEQPVAAATTPPPPPPPPEDAGSTRMMTTAVPPATVPPSEGYRQLEEPPPSSNLGFVLGAFALLATLGVLVFLVFRLLGGPGSAALVPVPDVVGMDQTLAIQTLREAGLFGIPQFEESTEVAAGLVIRTEPAALTEVEEGSSVDVFVSQGAGAAEVPTLIGLTQADAQRVLEEAGFVLGAVTTRPDDEAEPGTVVDQNPPAGGEAAPGSEIDLVVSEGPEPVEVPDVTNQFRDDALARLSQAGLTFEIAEEFSDTVEEDRVIRTDPAPLEEVEPGTVVLVVVSRGPEPIEVPNLRGLLEDEARALLDDLGLELRVSDATIPVPDPEDVGRIIEQVPEEGTLLSRGDSVAVTLGSAPPTTTTTVPETTTTVPETTTVT